MDHPSDEEVLGHVLGVGVVALLLYLLVPLCVSWYVHTHPKSEAAREVAALSAQEGR